MRILLIWTMIFLPNFLFAQELTQLVGEDAHYKVTWERIKKAADAGFSFEEDSTGRFYIARFFGTTNWFGSFCYQKLDKSGWSLIDRYTHYPLIFCLQGLTGDQMYDDRWHFQQNTSIEYQNIFTDTSFTIKSTEKVFDILSGLIEFRINVLKNWTVTDSPDTLYIPLVNSTQVFQIPVIYKGVGTVKLKGEKVETINFLVMLNSLSKQLFGADANLLIYFSVENHHLPIRTSTMLTIKGIPIGRIIGLIDLEQSELPYNFP